jgi:hypothetical protein
VREFLLAWAAVGVATAELGYAWTKPGQWGVFEYCVVVVAWPIPVCMMLGKIFRG